jgi:DNA polymerase
MVLLRGVTSLSPRTPAGSAAAALAFLVEAGADVAVADAPRRWLDAPPASMPAPLPAPAATAPAPAAGASASDPPAHPTMACHDVPALLALLAAFPQAKHRPPFLHQGKLDSGVWVLVDRPDDTTEHFDTITRMMASIQLDWDHAALVSRLAWPQPGEPTAALLTRFAPVLDRLATLVPPRLVLALGQTAAAVAGPAAQPASSRGQWFDWRSARLLPSIHPRVFQGNSELRKQAAAHLQLFKAALD